MKLAPYNRDIDRFALRFWSKVEILGPDDCWEWIGYRDKKGYGRFSVGGGNVQFAHRISYALSHEGEISDELRCLHVCDNPPCVNSRHLWLGTDADNVKDMDEKGRRWRSPNQYGENAPNVKLTEEEVLEIRKLREIDKLTLKEIAPLFNITWQNVYRIVSRITWKHI